MPKRKARHSPARRKSRSRTGTGAKLPKDTVTLVVILRAREGQEPLLEAELRALVGPTRKEEGCLIYALYRSADVPGTFFLHELWASREHHRLHTLTPHFVRWDARKDALLASREATFWHRIV